MNKLYVGFTKDVALPKGGCLFIDDELPDVKRAKISDPAKHGFNPLRGIDYKRARAIADVLYTIAPQGENTLAVRNGKRALLKRMWRIADAADLCAALPDEILRNLESSRRIADTRAPSPCAAESDLIEFAFRTP